MRKTRRQRVKRRRVRGRTARHRVRRVRTRHIGGMKTEMTTAETQRSMERYIAAMAKHRRENEETQRSMERYIAAMAKHRRENEERIRTSHSQNEMQPQKEQEEKNDQLGGPEDLLDKQKKKEQVAKGLREAMLRTEEARLRLRHPTLQDHALTSPSYKRNRSIIAQMDK